MFFLKPKARLLLITLLFSLHGYSQVIWNENSFAFTRDVATPENMNGALPINFYQNGIFFSSQVIAPAGFTFNYGLKTYSSFYVSPKGFLKLGSPITNTNHALDNTVIAPLYSGSEWDASYKITGTGAGLKLIVQFTGDMQPTGQPTSYQVWLYPSGKIQFVYQQINGYYGWQDLWKYKIFCQANIMGNKVIASVQINTNNNKPAVNYSDLSIIANNDTIYANTRLTFQPDTSKPAKPTAISFSNVLPGCFAINMTEGSNNESLVVLERADSGANYKTEKYFYTNTPTGNTQYSYQQAHTQPYWTYNYRVYVSNGLKNSDTLYGSLQTPMPLISGIKKIPGDYPTISALLQDAACKHMGPNLVIELQNNYSFAAENLPLSFNKELQNRFIQNITIGPAANASISMAANTASSLIYIDSVKHIVFDGRAGGTGTNRALTIFQQNPALAAIQYTNGADSGIINYCNILKKGGTGISSGAIMINGYNKNYLSVKRDVDALHITNNFIAADTNTIFDLVTIQPGNPQHARNMLIDGNYFSRFRHSAVFLKDLGEGSVVSNNHFFQPDEVRPESYLPIDMASCISAINTGTIKMDNNFFGGNTEKWGTGKFSLTGSGNFAFIHYQSINDTSKAFISNNKFGNIDAKNNPNGSPHLLKIDHGDVLVEGNRFGTADSTNSITYGGFMWPINLWFGTKTIRNNFFSGLQSDYKSGLKSNKSYVITAGFGDSLSISNNDIGGSDAISANSSFDELGIIDVVTVPGKIAIINNKIRGFSSINSTLSAISLGTGYTDLVNNKLVIDKNSIHNLQSAGDVRAVACFVNNAGEAEISNNNIYSLKTKGTIMGPYVPIGSIYGITYTNYNWNIPHEEFKGIINIYRNRIHSFESVRTDNTSIFRYDAIVVECPLSKIYNNDIRLGIDSKGNPVDSLTRIDGISISPSQNSSLNNHRHFIEHNSFYYGGKNMGGQFIKSFYDYQNVEDNNEVTITNNIFSLAALNDDINPVTVPYMQLFGTKPYTTNNLW